MNTSVDGGENVNKINNQYVSISEACEITGLSNSTLKRYMLNHDTFVEYTKIGREYRINIESLDVIKHIRKLYSSGLKQDDVHQQLLNGDYPVTLTVNSSDADNPEAIVNINDKLQELSNIKQLVQLQNDRQAILLNELGELKKSVDDKDKLIEQLIKDNQEVKKAMHELKSVSEGSANELKDMKEDIKSINVNTNKSWWGRLFGK